MNIRRRGGCDVSDISIMVRIRANPVVSAIRVELMSIRYERMALTVELSACEMATLRSFNLRSAG